MKKSAWILTLLISLLISSSCSNTLQDMLDQYNGNFMTYEIKTVRKKAPSPGDFDFRAEDMLVDEYFVYEDGTLNLAAPDNCITYKWVMTDPVHDDTVLLPLNLERSYVERTYTMYIPDSGLQPGTYKLTLTVMSNKGGVYTDSCGVIVYQHYDYLYWKPLY